MSRAQPEKDAEQEGGQRDAAGVGRRKHHSRLRMDGAHPDRPFWGWGSELHTSCMGLVHVPSTAWLAASYRHVLPPLKKILMCTNALTSLMNHFFISSFIIPSSWGHFQLMANSFVTLNRTARVGHSAAGLRLRFHGTAAANGAVGRDTERHKVRYSFGTHKVTGVRCFWGEVSKGCVNFRSASPEKKKKHIVWQRYPL